MKLGLIAGNRDFPLVFSRSAKQAKKDLSIVAICFHGETNPAITRYVDKAFWMHVGQLHRLEAVIRDEKIEKMVMAGQVTPTRIFTRKNWDTAMCSLTEGIGDFRPHTVFAGLIEHLETLGVTFVDTTLYVQGLLATEGLMNSVNIPDMVQRDVDFGLEVISRFVELDVGQTLIVKNKATVALEGLEGTDRCIHRAWRLAGAGCVVLKFSKRGQDLRFDVPVVGPKTLQLLRKIKAAALVLEQGKVIILEKERFLGQASRALLPVIGRHKR